MTLPLTTARLDLRPLDARDLTAFVAYRNDPNIARHQGWETPYSRADGQALLDAQRGMAFGEAGRWMQIAIVGRTDGRLRGDCAVYLDDEPPRTAELGITLAPRSHGSGLAAEALTAIIAALVGEHAVERLVMHVEPDNAPARRLAERLGFAEQSPPSTPGLIRYTQP
jgi:RimJ/RimL family protein N-acetyltransferase